MKIKPRLQQALLNSALCMAELSYAKRLKVASLLVDNGRIVSTGYNGTPIGADNTCEDEYGKTKSNVIHSEANCILWAARNGVRTNNCQLVCTHSPCMSCALMILQSGVSEVYYKEEYRDGSAIDFLRNSGVKVYKVFTDANT